MCIRDRFEAIMKKQSSDVIAQMNAGNDLLMPGLSIQKKELLDALNSGKLSQEIANKNVKKILELAFKSPVFTDYKYSCLLYTSRCV